MLPAQRQIVRMIRYMPPEKLNKLLKFAKELDDEVTPEDIVAIEAGKAQIARGESVSLDEFCRRHNL
jgi:hypothetical protein